MKGFPAWPGKVSAAHTFNQSYQKLTRCDREFQIVVPTDDLRKLQKTVDSKCVYFYGTHNQ